MFVERANFDHRCENWRGRVADRPLLKHEITRVRGLYRISIPEDSIRDGDQVVSERGSIISDLRILDVLAKPTKTYSTTLGTNLFVDWDALGSIDHSSGIEFQRLLRECDLLREPQHDTLLDLLDSCANRRAWTSGTTFKEVFRCKLTRKLLPCEFLILNNLSWCHSATSRTPGSGDKTGCSIIRLTVCSF